MLLSKCVFLSLIKNVILKIEDGQKATFLQTFCASTVGALFSISVASPLDVVKTRIQNKGFGDSTSGLKIVKDILSNEGLSAFTKGLTPKLLTVGPKLVFSFTVAQYLIAFFEEHFQK